MIYHYKARFEKIFQQLPSQQQSLVLEIVEAILKLFENREVPHKGLGLKKLFSHEELGAVFEARVSLAIRILFAIQDGRITFLMIGDHDEVKQFIRGFR